MCALHLVKRCAVVLVIRRCYSDNYQLGVVVGRVNLMGYLKYGAELLLTDRQAQWICLQKVPCSQYAGTPCSFASGVVLGNAVN